MVSYSVCQWILKIINRWHNLFLYLSTVSISFSIGKTILIFMMSWGPGCRRALGLLPQERARGVQPPSRILRAVKIITCLARKALPAT